MRDLFGSISLVSYTQALKLTYRFREKRTDGPERESTMCSFIFFLLSNVYKYWLEQPFLSGLQVLLFSVSAHYD